MTDPWEERYSYPIYHTNQLNVGIDYKYIIYVPIGFMGLIYLLTFHKKSTIHVAEYANFRAKDFTPRNPGRFFLLIFASSNFCC